MAQGPLRMHYILSCWSGRAAGSRQMLTLVRLRKLDVLRLDPDTRVHSHVTGTAALQLDGEGPRRERL